MINDIYIVLQTIINKEQNGYVTPEEFNKIAKQSQEKIFRSYFEDLNRDQNRENKGFSSPGHGNLVANQEERINVFATSDTMSKSGNTYPLPSDLYKIEDNGLIDDANNVIDKIPRRLSGYLNNSLAAPSTLFKVYERIGNTVNVLPAAYTGDVLINYIRKPADPVWGYTVVSNEPLYDAGSTTDFELHPSEFSNIVLEMLTYFGLNLREGEVVQLAQELKGIMFQKDNA